MKSGKCSVSLLWLKWTNVHSRALSQKSKPATRCGFNRRDENISLPSTAMTAGMLHNIHRISIIGHLYRPDIQIKHVPKAIDSTGREGTGGPSPPIERSPIAAKSNSNLNQVWAKPTKRQTEGSTEQHRNAATPHSPTFTQSVYSGIETIILRV